MSTPPDQHLSDWPIVDPVLPDDYIPLLRLTGGPANQRATVEALLRGAGGGGGGGGGMGNPMTAIGDIIAGHLAGTPVRVPGNASANRKFLLSQGTGLAAALPVWDLPTAADLTNGTTGAGAVVLANGPTLSNSNITGAVTITNAAAPAAPAAGKLAVWSDSTDKRLHDRNDAGTVATTVIADVGAANMFLTGISAAGVITKAAVTPANIAGGATGTGKLVLQDAPTINSAVLVTPNIGAAQGSSLNLATAGALTWNNDLGWARYQNGTAKAMKATDASDTRTLGDIWVRRIEVGQDTTYFPGAADIANYLQGIRACVAVEGDPDRWDKWETIQAYCFLRNLTRSSTTTNDYYGAEIQSGIADAANVYNVYQIFGANILGGVLMGGAGGNVTGAVHGVYGRGLHAGSGTVASARGVNGWARNYGTGTMTYAAGGNFTFSNENAAGTVGNADVVAGSVFANAGTITGNVAVFHAYSGSGAAAAVEELELLAAAREVRGTVGGNRYGVLIDDQAAGGGTVTGAVYNFYSKGAARMNVIDGKLGIGVSTPGQPLEVGGNIFINSAAANLYLKDTLTGLQVATSTVITPLANNSMRSISYTPGLVGWNISAIGNGEFNNVDVRGAIHAGVFVYNALLATAGTVGVFKSAAKLRSDVVVTAAPVYGTTTFTIEAVDQDGLPHAGSQLFVVGDILRLKGTIAGGVTGDTWFEVTAANDAGSFWSYTAKIRAGSNNCTFRAGLGIADYGLAGQGFIIETADASTAPYMQMATHAATFTSADAAGTLTVTPQLKAGRLNSSYGYADPPAADVYGFAAGQWGAGGAWVTVDQTSGVRIGSGTTARINLATDGSGFLANANISWTTAGAATIAGWSVNNTGLIKDTGTAATSAGMAPADFPFYGGAVYANRAAAPFRVNVAGALTATGATITGSISATAGAIGGWTISATGIINDAGSSSAGMAPADFPFYAGNTFANRATAPFRVTAAGALTATGATITGSISATAGAIGGWTISATGIINDAGANSAGMAPADFPFYAGALFANRATAPFRVTAAGVLTATGASLSGTITATAGAIGGWTISAGRLSSTNIYLDQSGSYIALGYTPPTSYLGASGFFVGPRAPFTSFWKLDDTADLIGGRTLTNNNGVTFVAGKVGNAAHFTATSNQYLTRATDPGLEWGAGSWCVSLWFRRAVADLTQRNLISKADAGNTFGYTVDLESPHKLVVWFRHQTAGAKAVVSAGSFNDTNWHHLLFWYDSATGFGNMRIDGGGVQQTAAALPSPINDNTGNLCLGAMQAGTGATSLYFDGDLDAVGFGKFAPTTAQQDQIYNAGAGTETLNALGLHLGTVTAGALSAGLSWDGASLAIVSGGGAVKIDVNGVVISSGIGTNNALRFVDVYNTNWIGRFTNYHATPAGVSTNTTQIDARLINAVDTNGLAQTYLSAIGDNGIETDLIIKRYSTAHATKANKGYITFCVASGVLIGDVATTAEAATSAALEIQSTTGALLLPRMSTTQRDALTPADGMMIYNNTANKVQARLAGVWTDL